MSVRPATYDDIDRMQAIEVAAGQAFRALGMDAVAEDPPPSAIVLTGAIGRGHAWVRAIDDVVVAYRLDDVVDGGAHLEQVSLDPSWAGRGLGRQLICDRVRRADGPVTLTTFADVAWNRPYYERLGFRVLDDEDLGPGLRAIRRAEIARGLDRWPRCAMRRP